MGLFGSKPERECKKARKKCEKQRKKCEKQCRRDRRRECKRSPYVVVEEYAGCCPNSCNRSYCHVDCFDPCPRYRVCRTRTCTNTCPVPRSCPSMMNCNPCMSLNSCDPCAQFNNMIASFPPGTDFTQLLATLPSILGTNCSNLAPFPSGLCDPSALIPFLGSLDPSQLASIVEGVKNVNPNLYNSLDLGRLNFSQPALPPPQNMPLPDSNQPASYPNPNLQGQVPLSTDPNYAPAPPVNMPQSQELQQIPHQSPQIPSAPPYPDSIPPLPPITHHQLYSKEPHQYQQKYAYDDYEQTRPRRSRIVNFNDDYGLDEYQRHSPPRYREY